MNSQNIQSQQQDLTAFRPAPSDEIDLGLLLANLMAQWKMIIAVTSIGALISLFFALNQQKIYRIESTLAAPTIGDLAEINEQNLISISPQVALDRVAEQLLSVKIQSEVFRDSELATVLLAESDLNAEQLFLNIRSNLVIERVDHDFFMSQDQASDLRKEVKITFDSSYPDEARRYVEALVNQSIVDTLEKIQNDVAVQRDGQTQTVIERLTALTNAAKFAREAKIARIEEKNAQKTDEIELELKLLEEKAREKRMNRILILKESLNTAKALGIEDPVTWLSEGNNSESALTPMALNWLKDNYPEFYRGTKHLSAEIEMLEQRENDLIYITQATDLKANLNKIKEDPELAALKKRENDTIHIEEYDSLVARIEQIQGQSAEFPNAQVANIAQPAVTPSDPFKPNRKLILAAGIVLSGFLGLFFALIRIAILSSKNKLVERTV